MFNISDYLRKFSKIEQDSSAVRSAVEAVLKELCSIDKVDFDIRKGTIFIKGSPVIRSIIFSKKSAIIASLKARLPNNRLSDIR
jgi:hypothetical protein